MKALVVPRPRGCRRDDVPDPSSEIPRTPLVRVDAVDDLRPTCTSSRVMADG